MGTNYSVTVTNTTADLWITTDERFLHICAARNGSVHLAAIAGTGRICMEYPDDPDTIAVAKEQISQLELDCSLPEIVRYAFSEVRCVLTDIAREQDKIDI